MKTSCPSCQTIFRITPEQLKARTGKVRCGQCLTVFNALDTLLEDTKAPAAKRHTVSRTASPTEHMHTASANPAQTPAPAAPETSFTVTPAHIAAVAPHIPAPVDDPAVRILLEPTQVSSGLRAEPSLRTSVESAPETLAETATPTMNEAETQQAPDEAAGLILAHAPGALPEHDQWHSGVIAESPAPPAGNALRWPYALTSFVLLLVLLGQLAFHFRSELAIRIPTARPALETVSHLLGADIPLPRHSELISIEASDLQADPEHASLLTLDATLRNRAVYAQAFPALELTLTNTDDRPVARRILSPADYLPARLQDASAFAANTDIAVRLWIETVDLDAAGYRLYVFYP